MSEPVKRVIIIFGSIAALLLIAYWLFWPAQLPPPDESRRLTHKAGYSLIVPENYGGLVNDSGDDTFVDWIHCQDTTLEVGNSTIGARRFRGEPDFVELSNKGFKLKGTFQGQEATIFNGPRGRGALAQWNYRIIVKIEGAWFELYATDLQYFEFSKHRFAKYLETFKYTPAPAATQPAATQVAPATTVSTTRGS